MSTVGIICLIAVGLIVAGCLGYLLVRSLKGASQTITTILQEELSPEDVDIPTEQIPAIIPENRDRARAFLKATYNVDDGDQAKELTRDLELPEGLELSELSDDSDTFWKKLEVIAEVHGTQALHWLAEKSTVEDLGIKLWTLRHNGQLPRWVPPLMEAPCLTDFRQELERRTGAHVR